MGWAVAGNRELQRNSDGDLLHAGGSPTAGHLLYGFNTALVAMAPANLRTDCESAALAFATQPDAAVATTHAAHNQATTAGSKSGIKKHKKDKENKKEVAGTRSYTGVVVVGACYGAHLTRVW